MASRSWSPLSMLFLGVVGAACGSPELETRVGGETKTTTASWIGLTVGQVVAQCGARDGDLRMDDEPPGKLRGVELDCGRKDPPKRVVLQFDYHVGLFSMERAWPIDIVKAQRVTRVLESTRAAE